MAAKALLIDLDGVIRRWPAEDGSLERAHGLPPGAIRATAFGPYLLNLAITGQVDDARWRVLVADALRSAHRGAQVDAAVAEWSASPGEVDAEVLALLRGCAGLRLVLVTNATSRLSADLRQLGIASLFHAVVNSSEVRVPKPGRRIFELALAAAGVQAQEAVFVDDSHVNVEAAARLGIPAHRFTSPPDLRAFLASHGVLAAP